MFYRGKIYQKNKHFSYMALVSRNKYINKVFDLANKCNNKVYWKIKIKPSEVKLKIILNLCQKLPIRIRDYVNILTGVNMCDFKESTVHTSINLNHITSATKPYVFHLLL